MILFWNLNLWSWWWNFAVISSKTVYLPVENRYMTCIPESVIQRSHMFFWNFILNSLIGYQFF
jgi:hypothetical protein